MTAKKSTPSVETANGSVSVDAEAKYKLTIAKAVSYLGLFMRPSDRNIEVTGEALLAIAGDAPEGAIVNVEKI